MKNNCTKFLKLKFLFLMALFNFFSIAFLEAQEVKASILDLEVAELKGNVFQKNLINHTISSIMPFSKISLPVLIMTEQEGFVHLKLNERKEEIMLGAQTIVEFNAGGWILRQGKVFAHFPYKNEISLKTANAHIEQGEGSFFIVYDSFAQRSQIVSLLGGLLYSPDLVPSPFFTAEERKFLQQKLDSGQLVSIEPSLMGEKKNETSLSSSTLPAPIGQKALHLLLQEFPPLVKNVDTYITKTYSSAPESSQESTKNKKDVRREIASFPAITQKIREKKQNKNGFPITVIKEKMSSRKKNKEEKPKDFSSQRNPASILKEEGKTNEFEKSLDQFSNQQKNKTPEIDELVHRIKNVAP